MMKTVDIIGQLERNRQEGRSCVLATVVEGAAGSPGRSGFKMLVYPDGLIEGTVGGGTLERKVIAEAIALFTERGTRLIEYHLTPDDTGMLCGGTARIFLEHFAPLRRAYLFGAGHLCRALAPLLHSIYFGITVIDDRPSAATMENVPEADAFFGGDYTDFLRDFAPNSEDAIIIFTHGHEHDFTILDTLCAKCPELMYIGMIGSRTKVGITLDKIRARSYPGNLVEQVWAPIGLNVARTTPAEIAIAITAEILAVYNRVETVNHMRNHS
jgi:xanthine dehydrogenase accessory factor